MTGPTASPDDLNIYEHLPQQEPAMHQLYDATQDSTPLPKYVLKSDANAQAGRSFWRGFGFGALMAAGALIGVAI